MDPQDLVPTATVTGVGSPTRAFGAYRLLQKIGEGGMGEVWLAEQAAPVRRQVALKVIKAGMDTAHVVARFEAERQTLALMNHPAIATVFDGGSTPEGRPYFAMEYVRGEPITTYCDRQRLTTRERLELFTQVCEGVEHAHQKGIIHRDLKPSNVLVAIQDDHPVPKIIDFGVAKATAQHLTAQTLFTEMGVLVGTPEYMSPEQAEMGGLDIDTRTDVYALGVILYELLTGALPFDRQELRQQGLAEIQRIIREKEPPRPSTRLTQDGPASAEAAKNRQTEPKRLLSQVRGDLDWVTMKALDKDRTRRYQTANAFAADVRRHLGNEPVSARPPSAAYQARKFARRHRVSVGAAATLIVLIAAFGVIMAVQAQRIAAERDRANREADTAGRVSTFLKELFRVADPSESRGSQVTARELLDRAAATIDRGLEGQPDVRGALMATMGSAYQGLGLLDQALPLLMGSLETARRLHGDEHIETAAVMAELADLYIERGDYTAAEPFASQSLDVRRRLLGPDHEQVASSLDTMGNLHYYKGDTAAAESAYREAVSLQRKARGSDDVTLARYQQDLALTLSARGALAKDQAQLGEAERLMRDNLAIERRHFGDAHPEVVISLNNLATLFLSKRDLDGAERTFREAIDISTKVYGEDNRHTALYMANLGYVHYERKRYAESEPLLRRALEIRRKVLPAGSAELGHSLLLLGRLLVVTGHPREAEPLLREVGALWRRTYSAGNLRTADADSVLGSCLTALARYDEAERLLQASYASITAGGAAESNLGMTTRARLAQLYEAWRKPDLAVEWRNKPVPAR